eukprot:2716510-Prymnesium_polylepis.1
MVLRKEGEQKAIRGKRVKEISTIGRSLGLGGATHAGIKTTFMQTTSRPGDKGPSQRPGATMTAGSAVSSNMILPTLNRSKTAPGAGAMAVTRGDLGFAQANPDGVAIPMRGAFTKRGDGERRGGDGGAERAPLT